MVPMEEEGYQWSFQWIFPEVSPFLNLTVKRRECMRSVINLLGADETYRRGSQPSL